LDWLSGSGGLNRVSWDKSSVHKTFGLGKILLGICNAICRVYLTVIRGTPVVVQIHDHILRDYGKPNNKILAGVIAFGVNSGAYVARLFEAALCPSTTDSLKPDAVLVLIMCRRCVNNAPEAFKCCASYAGKRVHRIAQRDRVAGYVGLTDLTRAANIIRGVSTRN
jgi:ABC-type arginine/histidine transport system permease subunit